MGVISGKIKESAGSILPIALIVLILTMTVVPVNPANMLIFINGVVCLILGMSVFTMGIEMSMQPMGTKIGSTLGAHKNIFIIAFVSFLIGVAVTFAEPDLWILAQQSGIPGTILVLTVSIGVGVFLMIALLRIVFNVSLNLLLIVFYSIAIVASFFVPKELQCIVFDSGGVTTGPMTVPFIMSLGAGVSAVISKEGRRDDSFGITALCSIGPIISVIVLGICMGSAGGGYTSSELAPIANTREGVLRYAHGFADSSIEVAKALVPIIVFAVFFQLLTHSFSRKQLVRLSMGIIYTFAGLTIFLTGANVGFVPMGTELGKLLGSMLDGALLIPVSMLLGYFIVKAEPSVYVLNRLVEQMSAGAISRKTTGTGLSVGVSLALGLSALRILFHIPIMYILIPGYVIAIALTFFVPKIFVGIAFDSGGVASGTMMSAFVLPLCIGACEALGGNVMTEAFGCVAFVALTPIISIQLTGLLYNIKNRRIKKKFVTESETFIDYTEEDAVRAAE